MKFYCVAKDGRFAGASLWAGAKMAVHDGDSARLVDCASLYDERLPAREVTSTKNALAVPWSRAPERRERRRRPRVHGDVVAEWCLAEVLLAGLGERVAVVAAGLVLGALLDELLAQQGSTALASPFLEWR